MSSSGVVGPSAGGGSWKRVLVVDPDEDTRAILGAALEAAGYQPLLASDAQSAFALAALAPIHLLISEATSLGTPDLPSALRASAVLARVPMIVYSSRALPGDMERALLAGASEVLVKPVRYRTILALVAKLTASEELPSPGDAASGDTQPQA